MHMTHVGAYFPALSLHSDTRKYTWYITPYSHDWLLLQQGVEKLADASFTESEGTAPRLPCHVKVEPPFSSLGCGPASLSLDVPTCPGFCSAGTHDGACGKSTFAIII